MSRLNKKSPELDNKPTVDLEPEKPAKEAEPPETVNLQPETRAKTSDNNKRTYVLRAGKTASFPIRFPNGQTVTVKFQDGMKELSGRLSNLFHAEYLANPSLRSKCSIVDSRVADNVARQHRRANPRVANPGLDSAKMSPAMKESMLQEAQMRHMQRRAAEGKTVDIQLPHELKTELEE